MWGLITAQAKQYCQQLSRQSAAFKEKIFRKNRKGKE